MAAPLIPSGRTLAQQVIVALVTAVAVAWVIGHVPPLRDWLKREEG